MKDRLRETLSSLMMIPCLIVLCRRQHDAAMCAQEGKRARPNSRMLLLATALVSSGSRGIFWAFQVMARCNLPKALANGSTETCISDFSILASMNSMPG